MRRRDQRIELDLTSEPRGDLCHVILSSSEQLLPGSTRDARMLALAYFGPRDLENGHAATQMHKRGAILF
jgi:hypothetical protein